METRTSGLRALILDYGEVLCYRPGPEKLARMAGLLGMDSKTFEVRYEQERGPYDRGDLTPADYWSKVVGGRPAFENGTLDKLCQWDVEMWSEINPAMIEWLGRVEAAGFKTALLSNMHADMALRVRRIFPWLERMDCQILSCEVRRIKPERAIYERCIEGLAVEPSEALFVDDREVNLRAARDRGLVTLRFEGIERLRNDLAGLGFPVLP
jgi:putative hydrolase of the HAD superfamily